jgi:hypothetical protein
MPRQAANQLADEFLESDVTFNELQLQGNRHENQEGSKWKKDS